MQCRGQRGQPWRSSSVEVADWTLLGQLLVTFLISFPAVTAWQSLRHDDRQVRYRSRTIFILCVAVYVLVGGSAWWQDHHKRVEQNWVKARVQWMDQNIRLLIGRGNTLKTHLLDEAYAPQQVPFQLFTDERFKVHEKLIGEWRDRSLQFLDSELPCTGVGVSYNFGGGNSGLDWQTRILDGTTSQLVFALTSLDSLVSRSCVSRSQNPRMALHGGQAWERPGP